MTDRELLQKWDSGNGQAFARLYHRYYADMFRYSKSFTFSEEKAKDAIHDAWEYILTNRSPSKIKNLRSVIFTALYISSQKKAQYKFNSHRDIKNIVEPSAEEQNHYFDADLLLSKLDKIPENYRNILHLRIYGFEYSEIAKIEQITEANVRVRLHRARKWLHEKTTFTSIIGTDNGNGSVTSALGTF